MRISDWSSDVCSSDLDDVIKSLDILLFHTPLVFRLSAHSHVRRRACGGRCSLLDNDGRVVNDSPLKVTPCQQPLQCCTPCELTTDRRSCLAPYQLGRVDDLQFALPRQVVERIAQASCLDAVDLWRFPELRISLCTLIQRR